MNDGIVLRRYVAADRDAAWSLHRVAMEATGAVLDPGPWEADLDDIEGHYVQSGGEFLVAERAGMLIGMGGLRRIDLETGEIKRMRVAPADQGSGIGTLILERLEAEAAQLGYRRLCLDTTSQQIGAQHFYRRRGYRETHRGPFGNLEIIFFEKIL